jgi:hypothetical protein
MWLRSSLRQLLLLLFCAALYSVGTLPAAPANPVIVSFSASATTVNPGYATKLSWSVLNATDLAINQGVGDVVNQAFLYVSPTQTTTYTLTAFNGVSTVTQQVTINVVDTPSPAFGSGASYYVSPLGSDSNSGLSPAAPWQTVAKVNGFAFQPGDKIFFQRGGEWRESLNVPSSGTAGNPIAFADYGSGAKPKFWGSVVLNNAAFSSLGNGLYAYSIASPVLAALVDHTFFYTSLTNDASSLVNSWSYNGTNLVINSPTSDPRTDGRLYTAVLRQDVVFSNYQSHLIFRNLVSITWPLSGWNAGEWHHVAGSWDGVGWNLFFDGVLKVRNSPANGPVRLGLPFTIGGEWLQGSTSGLLNARLDETRVSHIARSAGWISTEYNNQQSPATFLTLGGPQALAGGQVAAPVFTPAGGAYTGTQSVTIGTTTAGATIRYTTDGSTPTSTSGTVYSGAITVASTSTLKAIAYAASMTDSAVTTAAYTINPVPQVAAPVFTPAGGAYTGTQSVTIGTTTAGATIRYTTDGSTPSSISGTVYGGAISVASTSTLKAIAYAASMTDSAVTTAAYTINPVAQVVAPVFTPAGGTYTGTQPVTIGTTTAGATIRYTTDGSTPTSSSGTVYSGAITVASTSTLKAIAYAASMTDSAVTTAAYTIQAASTGGPAWYNSSWSGRKPVTVDHTKVSNSSTLANFPMLFSVTDAAFKAASSGGSVGKSDGTDILFTAGDGVTKLSHELESYNPTTGQLVAWVRLPALSNASDIVVYVYFGNSSAADQQNKSGVWDNNFSGVWHMSDNATSQAVLDSTVNAGNGSAQNPTSKRSTAGQIGNALVFDGSTDYVRIPNSPALDIPTNTPFTMETWVNVTAFPTPGQLFSNLFGKGYYESNEAFFLRIQNNNGALSLQAGEALQGYSTITWPLSGWNTGEWRHVAGSWDGANWNLFLDGALKLRSPSANGPAKLGLPFTIGGEWLQGNTSGLMAARIDEARVSNIARSAGWIATEFNNQQSPATFYTVGPTQTQ